MPATDPAIEALNLAPNAKTAAYALKAAHAAVVFTSGRRTRESQASAMANNVVQSGNRSWIAETYAASTARDRCQTWVDEHPQATTAAALSAGLLSVLTGLSDVEVARLSRHLSGMAFDVQPIADAAGGAEVRATIEGLANLDRFLTNEGGLVIWHAQFR